MFKLRNLFTLGMILVLGILVYNRFLGTADEQAQAKTTFQTIGKAFKEVGGAVGTLLKSEKEKFDEGKYNQAMDKIGDLFSTLSDKAKDIGETSEDYLNKLEELNKQKEALQEKIDGFKGKRMSDEQSTEANEELKGELKDLMDKITTTMDEEGIKEK
jgi:uncharacterized protein YukE